MSKDPDADPMLSWDGWTDGSGDDRGGGFACALAKAALGRTVVAEEERA